MKTQGEIEAAVCDGISRFEQEYMGRGPKDIHAHLIRELIVVRLQGVLTAAEQQLVKSLPMEKGRDLLKQVRTQLIETARPILEDMMREIARNRREEPASRHQHHHRRGVDHFHPRRGTLLPRDQTELTGRNAHNGLARFLVSYRQRIDSAP